MKSILSLSIVALAAAVPELHGQVDYNARAGLTWASVLMRDRIIDEISVRQKLAPTIVLSAALPIAPRYQAGLEVTLTSSGFRAKELGSTSELGTLRTGSATLGLHGPISGMLRWRAGMGILSYWPKEDRGIFLQGGAKRFLVGTGIDYRRPIMSQWDFMAALRYDFHRFTTAELRARGFSQSQAVHRIAVTIGLAGGRR